MKEKVKPVVTVIRPVLTDEEREERMAEIKRCLVNFWLAKERLEVKKNAPTD